MSKMEVGVGFVRWKELIPILIAIFSMAVSISIGALFIHGQTPHKDAVPRPEFQQMHRTMDRIMNKIDRIAEKVTP